jgi:hypothetical protein
MKKKILLISEFGDNIFTRSSMSDFFENINFLKDKKITLDFKGIKFISRSCADEYLKQKKFSKKEIVEVNMSKEVCSMFKNVDTQYKNAGLSIVSTSCLLEPAY